MKLFDQARHSTWSIYKCNHEVVIFCYYPWKIFSCDLSSVNCQHFFFFWWVNIYFCDTPMQIFSNVSKLIFLSFSSENQDEDSFVKNIVRCLMWLGVENYPVLVLCWLLHLVISLTEMIMSPGNLLLEQFRFIVRCFLLGCVRIRVVRKVRRRFWGRATDTGSMIM